LDAKIGGTGYCFFCSKKKDTMNPLKNPLLHGTPKRVLWIAVSLAVAGPGGPFWIFTTTSAIEQICKKERICCRPCKKHPKI